MGVETALTITLKGKNATGAAFAGVGKQLRQLNRETQGWRGGLESANRSLIGLGRQADIAAAHWSGLTTAARSAGLAMTGIGMASVAALGLATRAATEFDQGMRNVNSIMQLSESGFANLGNQVKAIASEPMVTDMPTTLAEGLYDIVSSGLEGQVALDTLKVASQGAAAGLSTTATAAQVLASVMNAYNTKTGADAAAIMDVLFKTVDRGVVTFDELAQSFAFASTTAAAAGVPLADVAAGMMTMTKQGHDAAIASVSLARIITSFLNPTKELTAALKAQGYVSGLQVLRTRGLSGAVEFLSQTYAGNVDQMVAVLGEQRSVRAAMAMTGKGAQMYAEDLAAAGNATGAMSKALEQQAKGAEFQWKELKKQFALMAIEAGEELLPALRGIVEELRPLVQWAAKFVSENPDFTRWAAGFGLMSLAMGPLLMNLTNLIRLTTMAKGAWALLLGAQGTKMIRAWAVREIGPSIATGFRGAAVRSAPAIGQAAATAMGDQGPLVGETIARSASKSTVWAQAGKAFGVAAALLIAEASIMRTKQEYDKWREAEGERQKLTKDQADAFREAGKRAWLWIPEQAAGKHISPEYAKEKGWRPEQRSGQAGYWIPPGGLPESPEEQKVAMKGYPGSAANAPLWFQKFIELAIVWFPRGTKAGLAPAPVGPAAAQKMPEEVKQQWADYFRLAQQHLDWKELMAPGEWSAARDQVIIGMNRYADELIRIAEFESDEAQKRAMLMEANDKRIAALRLAKEEGPAAEEQRWQEYLGALENRAIWAKQRGGVGVAQAQEDLARGQYAYAQSLLQRGDILGYQAAWRDYARSHEESVRFWKDTQMNVNVYVGNEPVDARIEKNMAGARYARTPA